MTFDNEIDKVKSEIKVLEKKLSLLEEIEKHNTKPKMTIENGDEGSFSVVTYDDAVYYRLDFPYAILWYKRIYKCASDEMRLIQILDLETYRLLEDAWNNEVIAKKDTEPSMINCILEGNPPDGYSYWNVWFRECGSKGILHNLRLSSKDYKKPEPYCPNVPPEYDETGRGEEDNPTEPTRNKYFERILNAPIDERGYIDLREPTSEFRQKLFDGIKSVFYDPEYERTHWSVKVNMVVDEVLTHFEDILPASEEPIHDDYDKGWNWCLSVIRTSMEKKKLK